VTNSFELTEDAERDIIDIYLYTLQKFGPLQAGKYTSELFGRISDIAAQPSLGRDFSDVHPGTRRSNQASHAIYYRQTGTGVLILRILHQRMDPARHLGRT
jgi:toxin ParE1/3/4